MIYSLRIFNFLVFSFCATILLAQPLVIAHRGASAYEPENTLAAFEKAIEMGADYIETDVHQTKDSVLVLMHDLTVSRTCEANSELKTKLVKELSYTEFSSLKIKGKKYAPPTLEAALNLINGRCKLLIELKKGSNYYPGIEKRVMNLIKKNNAESWADIIHSFDKKALLKVNEQKTGIKLQKLIVFKFPLSSFNFSKGIKKDDFSDWRGVNVYYRFARKKLIKKLHKQGKTVYVWTVNNPKKAKELIKRGVDGIITNKPDIIKEILVDK